jgi:hypothetical protein
LLRRFLKPQLQVSREEKLLSRSTFADWKPVDWVATAFVAFGFVLYTYVHAVEAESFSVQFWLFSLSPYIAGTVILVRFRHAHATIGALAVPVLVDLFAFHEVFVAPDSSTASLLMLFTPLWNLFLFVPVGAAVGRWVRNRLDEASVS